MFCFLPQAPDTSWLLIFAFCHAEFLLLFMFFTAELTAEWPSKNNNKNGSIILRLLWNFDGSLKTVILRNKRSLYAIYRLVSALFPCRAFDKCSSCATIFNIFQTIKNHQIGLFTTCHLRVEGNKHAWRSAIKCSHNCPLLSPISLFLRAIEIHISIVCKN